MAQSISDAALHSVHESLASESSTVNDILDMSPHHLPNDSSTMLIDTCNVPNKKADVPMIDENCSSDSEFGH